MHARNIKPGMKLFLYVNEINNEFEVVVKSIPDKTFSSLNELNVDDVFIVETIDGKNRMTLFPRTIAKNMKRLSVRTRMGSSGRWRNACVKLCAENHKMSDMMFI